MAITGTTGTLVINSSTICFRSWEMTQDTDMRDSSCNDTGQDRTFLAGLTTNTASFETVDDVSALNTYTLYAVSLTNDEISFSGSAYVNNLSVNTPYDDIVVNSGNLQFSSTVTVS